MFENKIRTEINSIGEYKLKELLISNFKSASESQTTGLNDDAAVVEIGDRETATGMIQFIENVHFDLSYMPLKHLGYKAIVAGISQIAAMNIVPSHILVGVAVSNRFSLEAVEEIIIGIQSACVNYKLTLSGLETTNSLQGLILSVTAFGIGNKGEAIYRSGAGEGDLIAVSGDLGAAYLGLQLLEREKRIFLERPDFQPDLEGNEYILQRQLRPEARVDIRNILLERELKPTAMINMRLGLSAGISLIGKQSRVGAVLYEHTFPIDPQTYQRAMDFGIDPTVACLDGGEDYEILFTFSKEQHDKIKGNSDLTVIGHCTAAGEGIHMVSKSNVIHPIKPLGWSD